MEIRYFFLWGLSFQQIIIASTRNSGTQVLYENGKLFDSPCWPRIYLPRKMKGEPDLNLVWDKFLVSYEC